LPAAPEGVTIERDVAYLPPDRAEKLDLYLPSGRPVGARSPGVVIIHGGGWAGGTKSAGREFNIGTTLAKAGYVCASIDYRLEAQGRWPTNVQDCKNAVRFLRARADRYGVDTGHIGVIGGSAGGHLALMVGFTDAVKELEPTGPYPGVSDRVQAVADLYGIADVRTGVKTDADGTPTADHKSWDGVFGDHKPITEADRALASPTTHLEPHIPPVLILHGTADTTVDRNQSIDLDKRLTALNLPHQLILLPGIGHTFDLQTWGRKPLPADLRPTVVGFFDRYLKAKGRGR
jgi:acetyl esterase/lipase